MEKQSKIVRQPYSYLMKTAQPDKFLSESHVHGDYFSPILFLSDLKKCGIIRYWSKDKYDNRKISEFLFSKGELLFGCFGYESKSRKKRSENDAGSGFFTEENVAHYLYEGQVFTIKNESLFIYCAADCPPLFNEVEKFIKPETDNSKIKFNLIIREYGEIVIREFDTKLVVPDNWLLNYPSGFEKTHEQFLKRLEDGGGIYSIHGNVGCGKSSYIKYLTTFIKRKVIYVPTTMIDALISPDFINLLLNHPKSVLVIEDAEKAIQNRKDSYDGSLVSTLLNLSDGILSTICDISIIVTYNCPEDDIDPALLRKGRLKLAHEFVKLPIPDAQKLIDHLDFEHEVVEPMSIADIYNLHMETGYKPPKQKRMGFGES